NPNLSAKSCNSQLPDFEHTKQSFGWSDSNNSNTILLAFNTRIVLVLTTMPSNTGVAQAGAKFLLPSTSTTQILQEAALLTIFISCKSRWHKVGISIPIL